MEHFNCADLAFKIYKPIGIVKVKAIFINLRPPFAEICNTFKTIY